MTAGGPETSINLIKRLKSNGFIKWLFLIVLNNVSPICMLYKHDSTGLDLSMIVLDNYFYMDYAIVV